MNNSKNKEYKLGEKFGKYTIISTIPHKIKNETRKGVLVKCECGVENIVRYDSLLKNKRTSCFKCKITRKKIIIGKITSNFFNEIKGGARQRNIKFDLSREYLWDLFLKQEKKCIFTNIELEISDNIINRKPNRIEMTASLDRINPNEGYVEGNVQWVHKWVNIMKSCLNNQQFIYICQLISNNHQNFIYDNTEPNFLKGHMLRWHISQERFKKKVQRLTVESDSDNTTDTSAQHPFYKDEDIV